MRVAPGAVAGGSRAVAEPASYAMVVRRPAPAGAGPEPNVQLAPPGLPLNPLLGRGLRIEFLGRITCSHCSAVTARSYGGGYCYDCFRSLARCDLCVVSPVRCHYALGTCREPAWGEAFCMRPHLLYLANSSGPKVGLTSAGGELTRWLDQGASQGLVVARADSRQRAGLLEAAVGKRLSDRTDWRALLRSDAAPVDLAALRDTLRPALRALPEGVRWLPDGQPVALAYPLLAYPRTLRRLRLDRHPLVAGRLLGVKGQYLLFEHGVFNVRWHRAFHVRVSVFDPDHTGTVEPAEDAVDDPQMELFS